MSAFRKLLAAGAMSTLVRAAVSHNHRADLTRRARLTVQSTIRKIALLLAAGVLFTVAAGFLVASLYLWLLELVDPPLAALLTGVLLVLGGVAVLLIGRKETVEAPEEAPPVEDEGMPPQEAAVRILQDFTRIAGKNIGIILAALFLVGLWFGFGREEPAAEEADEAENDVQENEPHPKAAQM